MVAPVVAAAGRAVAGTATRRAAAASSRRVARAAVRTARRDQRSPTRRWLTVALVGLLVLGSGSAITLTVAVAVGLGGGAVALDEQNAAAAPPVPGAGTGLPSAVQDAYVKAAAATSRIAPSCTGMRWAILAGIGEEESHQGAGHAIAANGTVSPPILGPVLDGSAGTAVIADTDGGRWDGDTVYDRAVGPMQFIPSTWRIDGRDGNGDGVIDPENFYDAAQAAVLALCAGRRNLADPTQLSAAIFSYNHSDTYVAEVEAHIATYDSLGSAAATAPTALARTVLAAADAQLGKPYLWGGNGPAAFDCSGLTVWAYRAAGIALPRVAQDQYNLPAGGHWMFIPPAKGFADVSPGDLVFFGPITDIYHVGIYVGAGKMLDAPNSRGVVRVETIWPDYSGATHYLG